MSAGLAVWVLYENPSDFPGEWVVRRQTAHAGEIRRDGDLAARGPTREACERSLFARFPELREKVWLPRHVNDDPVIVGSWM